MGIHRSAMGKQIDMASLAAKNEKVRAVGNMSVNARGDTIDSHGRVIQPVTEKASTNYSKTVGNRSAQSVKQTDNTKNIPKNQNIPQKSQPIQNSLELDEITDLEKELDDELESDLEVEKIKAEEIEKNDRKETSVQPNKNQKSKTPK